jgi:hypothetical protein
MHCLTAIAILGSLKSHLIVAGHVAAAVVGRSHHGRLRASSVLAASMTT